jgi:hypothetical protein
MSILYRIIIILAGGLLAVIVQLLSLVFADRFIFSSSRDILMVGNAGRIIYLGIVGFYGLALATILCFVNSFRLSLLISLLFSLWISRRTFAAAREIYQRSDYFDRESFFSEILMIGTNFVVYPLVSIIIWKLKRTLLNN